MCFFFPCLSPVTEGPLIDERSFVSQPANPLPNVGECEGHIARNWHAANISGPKVYCFGILVPQLHLNNDKSFVLGELGKPRLVLIIEPQAKFGYYFSNHV